MPKEGKTPASRPEYFTCTLAEALEYNTKHHSVKVLATPRGSVFEHEHYGNINEFVDFLSANYGEDLAVGCAFPSRKPEVNGTERHDQDTSLDEDISNAEQLDFNAVKYQSCRLANFFIHNFGPSTADRRCVTLLASSSMIFMLIWLSLIRAGHEVLLIAPQSVPTAITHLVRSSSSFLVIHDAEHEDIVTTARNSSPELDSLSQFEIPWSSLQNLIQADLPPSPSSLPVPGRPSMTDTAFYFHSSGTTGVPKLIPQTHNGAVGILPLLQFPARDGPRIATFTATPLYSGGIADLLRAWSAASPLWIFPEGRAPIIGSTVQSISSQIDNLSEIHTNGAESSSAGRPWRLGYLSCVPFILENIVETPGLKKRLLAMDAVGVGGAAMPKAFGDRLVTDGIGLVSRFGSSECGFLLSSARNYDEDKGWDILRVPSATGLQFKNMEVGDGKCELIVLNDWPMVSTADHAVRPFNTHDVFIPHEDIRGAWTYAGRSDAQITLKTGKKFDPVIIEDALRESELIEDAIVVGDDRPFAAAFFIPSPEYHSLGDKQGRSAIWDHVKFVNGKTPSHAKLGEWSWIVLNETQIKRVRRNPKGGIVRSAIAEDFEEELTQIYETTNPSDTNGEKKMTTLQSADEVEAGVKLIVQEFFDRAFDLEKYFDFFDAGVNSTMQIQMRKKICNILPEELQKKVPLNVIYECGTVDLLVKFVKELFDNSMSNFQRRTSVSQKDEERSKHQEMLSMAERYVSAQPSLLEKASSRLPRDFKESNNEHERKAILLTGATGFLGAHILNLFIHDSSVTRIFLCIRGSHLVSHEQQQERAKARITSALTYHKFALEKHREDMDKIVYVPCFLNEPDLGIPAEVYTTMVEETTHIIHAAWEVNFNLPLKTFASQIEGTVNLFNLLALSAQHRKIQKQLPHHTPSLLFCSSMASVAKMQCNSSAKPLSTDPSDAADLGYGQSKWVAESVLNTLSQRNTDISVSILRVGQLSGSTKTGIWNRKEAWPLMIDASLNIVGGKDRAGDGLESAPRAIILPDIASTSEPPLDWLPVDTAAKQILGYMKEDGEAGVRALQVLNDGSASPSWTEAQAWILGWAKEKGIRSEVVSPEIWLREVQESSVEHQGKALVSLWKKNWVDDGTGEGNEEKGEGSKIGKNGGRGEGEGKMNDDVGINQEYLRGVLDWIVQD